MKKVIYFGFVLITALLYSCNNINYNKVPLHNEDGHINAIIEIPSGTNHKIEYDPEDNDFKCDKINNKDRVIDFLPYPANYGFIASTRMDTSIGGDGDPLDVIVISESVPTGTVIQVIPIAMMKMIDDGEFDYKCIAIPSKPELRVIKCLSYGELLNNYPEIIDILTKWFTKYKGTNTISIDTWINEQDTKNEIKKWSLN